jgi:hypothetical protein
VGCYGERMSRLQNLAALFESEDAAADVLRIYLNLHRGKLGAHWLWAVVARVVAGEDVRDALADYGYRKAETFGGGICGL